MNKDLKIAIAVIAIILMIIIMGDSPSQATSNKFSLANSYQSNDSASEVTISSSEKSCYHNGIELKGKVQFVDSFPDLKVKFVSSFADIDVKFVSSFPDNCGEWQEVSSFPDFTIQVVDSFPDIEVKKVSSFPGMN